MRLANLRKLSALDGIEHMTGLETLEIQGSRSFTSIAPLAGLKDLEVLNISGNGDIETLAPLVGLTKLRKLFFYESTNIVDGDLTPIIAKNLIGVAFQNRRHYSHKAEEFAGS